jgi:hypothetical protein
MWRILRERPGGDWESVDLLNAIKTHGRGAVEEAAREALALGAVAVSDRGVRADSLDMVSMLRTKCRPALEVTARRPWHGRLQDEEDLRDEEDGCEEVAAGDRGVAWS